MRIRTLAFIATAIMIISSTVARAQTVLQSLPKGQQIISENGNFMLIFQDDNNLCIYDISYGQHKFLWCSGVFDRVIKLGILETPSPSFLGLNSEGEFGFYEECPAQKSLVPYSFKHTFGSYPGANKFILDNDGQLKVINENKDIVWSNYTGGPLHESSNWSLCSYFEPPQDPNPVKQFTSYPMPPKQFGVYYNKYVFVDNLIHLLATPSVEDRTMKIVAEQYHWMIQSLKSDSDKERLKNLEIVLMSQYDKPTQMPLFYGPNGDAGYLNWLKNDLENNYRGAGFPGAGVNNLSLITEEMICRVGVATRGPKDTSYRGLDQVVHELGHLLDFMLGFQQHRGFVKTKDNTVIEYTGLNDLVQKYNQYAQNHGLGQIFMGTETTAYAFQDWFSQDHTAYPARDRKTVTRSEMHPILYQFYSDYLIDDVKKIPILDCKQY